MLTAIPVMQKGDKGDLLARSSCLVPISVGQRYHEDESFEAAIQFINKTFYSAVFIVADTLQAYNIRDPHETLEETRKRAQQLGTEWLHRNNDKFSKLKIDYKIIRWDEELADADYLPELDRIQAIYRSNEEFKKALEHTIGQFCARRYKKPNDRQVISEPSQAQSLFFHPDNNLQKQREQSREYLFEECAVLKLWKKYNCHYLVYPKKLTPVLQYLVDQKENISFIPLSLRFVPVKQLSTEKSPPITYEHSSQQKHYSSLNGNNSGDLRNFAKQSFKESDYKIAIKALSLFQMEILQSPLSPEAKATMAFNISCMMNSLSSPSSSSSSNVDKFNDIYDEEQETYKSEVINKQKSFSL